MPLAHLAVLSATCRFILIVTFPEYSHQLKSA